MIYEEKESLLVKVGGGSETRVLDLIKEHRLFIYINGKKAYRITCTKSDLNALVYGRLFTDGYISADLVGVDVSFDEEQSNAYVTVPSGVSADDTYICDTINAAGPAKDLKNIKASCTDYATVFMLADRFKNDGALHKSTSSTHRCILFKKVPGEEAEITSFEDISRHNAVDKAIGHAIISHYDMKDCTLFVSGRVPVDMAEKVIAAGIPVLISKSVPTVDTCRLAAEYGLTLITRAWPDSFCLSAGRAIVPASKEDSAEILALYKAQLGLPFCAWNDGYPSQETIDFDLSRNALFVMKENGRIISAISLDLDKNVEALSCWNPDLTPSGELSRMCVLPGLQGRGIAGFMMRFGFEEYKRRGMKSVHFLVNKHNEKAIKSYAPLACNIVGEVHMYDQDFLCYEKKL